MIARCGDIPVYTSEFEVLTQQTGFQLTRSMLCAMCRPWPQSEEEVCVGTRRVTVLEAIMNHTDVGAVFRSAAALNIDAVLLTPGCSDPLYRRSVRVSMGTVFQIPWAYLGEETADWPGRGLQRLREMGFKTAAMALSEDSITIKDPQLMTVASAVAFWRLGSQ